MYLIYLNDGNIIGTSSLEIAKHIQQVEDFYSVVFCEDINKALDICNILEE